MHHTEPECGCIVLDLVGAGSVIFIMSKIFIMCILIDQLEETLL